MIEFTISGVETYWWLPGLVAFGISVLMAPGGLSGAFLLLPFQISILGFTGPAVTPTNLLFNVIAIPSGVIRYCREKRMIWPLAWALIIGTLPGIFIGVIIRIQYLPDPRSFKFFVGCVLLYVGGRLAQNIFQRHKTHHSQPSRPNQFQVSDAVLNVRQISYFYEGNKYSAPTWAIFLLSFVVGIIGGVYGIGGGAIIAPFLVAVFRFNVHSIAGSSLLSTLTSSIVGVLFYAIIAPFYNDTGLAISPDWMLGLSFGLGGMLGIYLGASLQRYFPAILIKSIIATALLYISVKYIVQFFL